MPEKTFDGILADILADFSNILPGVDVSQGSLAYMKAAGYASALWGLYRYAAWVGRQAFPDTADTEALEHHAWVRGLTRTAGMNDAELLTLLLEYIRRPPAGGNKYDYEKWALSIDNVAAATCIPLAQGPGTVDVVIFADVETTGSEIPDAELLAEVAAYIEEVRPVTASVVRVLPPTIVTQAVTMTGVGAILAAEVAADITAYLDGFVPGQALYLPALTALAINAGAVNPVVTVPAAAVTPASGSVLRAGTINVS